MFKLFRFLFLTKNRFIYRQIADEHCCSSWYVYRLARGKRAKTDKDYCILIRLKENKIIERVLYHG